uniref:Uncharacterized protein n=1 Tax=Sciurus vulgaris TaxID=55149 RepID=A0A8D2AR22_SCIVU
MTVSKFASMCTMGANASAVEKEIGPEQFPVNEHYFGLFNFGNICYCNSVLRDVRPSCCCGSLWKWSQSRPLYCNI